MPNFWNMGHFLEPLNVSRERIGCATSKVVCFDTIREMIVSPSIGTSREKLLFCASFRPVTPYASGKNGR
jgi:hypothetical protein